MKTSSAFWAGIVLLCTGVIGVAMSGLAICYAQNKQKITYSGDINLSLTIHRMESSYRASESVVLPKMQSECELNVP